ncbi:hypothetical protein GCK72_021723 [Caenorhabditis remanei]|uniref:F-box domain-containing protein n=1 Tax=Caenorhabditis remanei TaxID=31234 RepID=A0A6A5GKB5_CAERE|nr:hypothetical protein GCK72_021723 [Caenorhabditis remanei]KAF1755154.1 hypothetical protein GCK72_021723 [Caenorhabditis remanei]
MAASWSDLSTELKQNVVGKLDLMSRHSLRSTSRLNRFVVDFTDCFVPRVRVSVKDSEFLIMIHMGIDKFLRIEMWIGSQGKTIIRKLQNSYDAKDATEKVLPSTPRYNAAQILCGLLSREKTLIGVMEWEFEGGIDVEKQEQELSSIKRTFSKIIILRDYLQKYSQKDYIFRVNKLMTSWNLTFEMEAYLRDMLNPENLKKIERIDVRLSKSSVTPVCSVDTYVPLSVLGRPAGTNTVFHDYIPNFYKNFLCLSKNSPGFGVLRFAKFDETAKKLWNSVEAPVEKWKDGTDIYRRLYHMKTSDGKLFIVHERSACGYWVYSVMEANLEVFDEYDRLNPRNSPCRLDWLCKRCTDPFEYNHYQNMGRRIVREPKWTVTLTSGSELDSAKHEEVWEACRKRYEKEESSEDVTIESDDVTNFMKLDRSFQKWAILITSLAFLTFILYSIFFM